MRFSFTKYNLKKYVSISCIIVSFLLLLSIANCEVPGTRTPHIFSPPKWIIGTWKEDNSQKAPFIFTFYKDDINAGGRKNFSELYASAPETSDATSSNVNTYTITLANSEHTFEKKEKKDGIFLVYSFKNLKEETSRENIDLKKITQ